MITNRSPWDYRKRIVIKSQLVRLCEVCGSYVAFIPSIGSKACMSCKHVGNGVEVWEHMAHIFRHGLMEKEIEKAYYLAGLMDEYMPTFGGAMKLNYGGAK